MVKKRKWRIYVNNRLEGCAPLTIERDFGGGLNKLLRNGSLIVSEDTLNNSHPRHVVLRHRIYSSLCLRARRSKFIKAHEHRLWREQLE